MLADSARRRPLLILVGIWLAWAVCLIAFQELVVARLAPDRPDHVLVWTAEETGVRRFGGRPYLAEPTLNTHVAFDSEYYLSIAVIGYDDPEVPQYEAPGGDEVPLNYAFLPAYPFVMRVVAVPLGWLGIEPIAAAAAAGVIVSLLATLLAMLALFALARRHLGEGGALRSAFYLLVFPRHSSLPRCIPRRSLWRSRSAPSPWSRIDGRCWPGCWPSWPS